MKIINFNLNIKIKDFYIYNIIIPLAFISFALILMPINQVFYFDTDEGIELTKASLYSQNLFPSYELWDPQPLLFNIILAQYLNFFSFSIFNARFLTLIFATILVWSFAQILRFTVGNITAIVSVFLLIISSNFLRLSVSVMQGIPCLSLAVLSIYFLILYSQNFKLYYLIFSGMCLATSLQIKMITVFIIPVILVYLFFIFPNLQKKTIAIFAWLVSFSFIFIIIGLTTHSLDLERIFLFHVTSNLKQSYQGHNSLKDVILIYLQNFDFVFLALGGLTLKTIKTKKNYIYILPSFWLVTITFLLINHKPVWYHYIILVSLPLIWLTSYSLNKIITTKKLHNIQFNSHKLLTFSLIFTLFVIPVKLGIIQWQNHLFLNQSQPQFENLERILTYKDKSHWLFTDVAMYSFYSQINIPPEIAVLPAKRFVSGNLQTDVLLKVLNQYQPEQILIERFPFLINEIKPYLDKNYQKIYKDEKTQHYILKQLNPPKSLSEKSETL